MLQVFGYIAAAFIGLSLGLIGGGGSILTVPVLVYLFGIDAVSATAYSLFIVGATSLAGTWPKYKEGLVDLRIAGIFGAPSIVAVYLTRSWLLPLIPDPVFTLIGFDLSKRLLVMGLFAILMVFASLSMIRDKKPVVSNAHGKQGFRWGFILLEGIVVGALTGLVGAGGGFLIIPALVLLTGLPMKKAVGTSLLIISAKSLIGFTGDLGQLQPDWSLLGMVTAIAIGGILIGNALARKIDSQRLKKGFGWFVLLMGIYILLKESLG